MTQATAMTETQQPVAVRDVPSHRREPVQATYDDPAWLDAYVDAIAAQLDRLVVASAGRPRRYEARAGVQQIEVELGDNSKVMPAAHPIGFTVAADHTLADVLECEALLVSVEPRRDEGRIYLVATFQVFVSTAAIE